MVNVVNASLEGKVQGFGPLRFTRVEWWDQTPKFALLKYSLHGKELEFGVRHDLDKRMFLDDVDDDEQVTAVKDAAASIWEKVNEAFLDSRRFKLERVTADATTVPTGPERGFV